MTIDWSKRKATRRATPEGDTPPDTAPLPEVPEDRRARRLTRSKDQAEAELRERLHEEQLVHNWLMYLCRTDPDFRRTYEDYIGPVPVTSYRNNKNVRMRDQF